ncbi:hypothetical protein M9Y10_020344 [Tritrichomonas musculus]|uniref:Uncharacterized protein n=1 Tax=Tritrichomonas musculus TaxID=1915356 RepID=A0ABR2HFY3_9EUKA
MYLLFLASKNRCKRAHFACGYFHHKGDYIKRDINEAIHYYKEGSSLNDEHAKNNLGVIYKKGFESEITAKTGNAIPFFEEAIRQKNDILSMYNLANIYIYDENVKNGIDKAIELLIDSSSKFIFSHILLCIALVKKFGFKLDKIEEHIQNIKKENSNIDSKQIRETFCYLNLNSIEIFTSYYEKYRDQLYLYDYLFNAVPYSEFMKQKKFPTKNDKSVPISDLFWEGFGIEI